MARFHNVVRMLAVAKDTHGQDLVEYALLAGFVAVASGVFIPDISSSLSSIYSRLASRLTEANG